MLTLLCALSIFNVIRNPKDTCVSMFHHEKLMPNSGLDKNASFDDYSKLFMEGKLFYGDYWTFLKVNIINPHHDQATFS